jgi:hypothetical protein
MRDLDAELGLGRGQAAIARFHEAAIVDAARERYQHRGSGDGQKRAPRRSRSVGRYRQELLGGTSRFRRRTHGGKRSKKRTGRPQPRRAGLAAK